MISFPSSRSRRRNRVQFRGRQKFDKYFFCFRGETRNSLQSFLESWPESMCFLVDTRECNHADTTWKTFSPQVCFLPCPREEDLAGSRDRFVRIGRVKSSEMKNVTASDLTWFLERTFIVWLDLLQCSTFVKGEIPSKLLPTLVIQILTETREIETSFFVFFWIQCKFSLIHENFDRILRRCSQWIRDLKSQESKES